MLPTTRAASLIAVLAALLVAGMAGAQPPAPQIVTETTELAGAVVNVDVYRPFEGAADGVSILAHGFTRDRTRDRDLALDLAASGIVAIAPDLPNVVDFDASGAALEELVSRIERGAFGLPPTARSRIVLIGTSAGGVATVIAASRLPGLAGWIGLDPVDRWGVATSAAARLQVPAVVLLGDPSVCNLFGSGKAIAAAVPTLLRVERMRGASHCDFEGPTTKFCRTVCGRSDAGMAARVRREAVMAAGGHA